MVPAGPARPVPPRMPKLTYRNPLPADQIPSPSFPFPATSKPTSDTVERIPSTTSSMPTSALDSDARSTATSSGTTRSGSSNGSVSHESKTSSKNKKKNNNNKKKNGVLNFLTLKEPSQIALDQFADAQRKQMAARGGPKSPVGLPGVSPQRLPGNVPKVNSKWDGVPDSLKSSRSSTTSKRNSTISQMSQSQLSHLNRTITARSSTSVASDDSRGPPNSLASPMQSTIEFSDKELKRPPRSTSLLRSDSVLTSPPAQTIKLLSNEPRTLTGLPSEHEAPTSTPSYSIRVDAPSHRLHVEAPSELVHVNELASSHYEDALSFEENAEVTPELLAEFDDRLVMPESDLEDSSQVNAIFRRLKGEARDPEEFDFGADGYSDVPETHDFLFETEPTFGAHTHTNDLNFGAPATQELAFGVPSTRELAFGVPAQDLTFGIPATQDFTYDVPTQDRTLGPLPMQDPPLESPATHGFAFGVPSTQTHIPYNQGLAKDTLQQPSDSMSPPATIISPSRRQFLNMVDEDEYEDEDEDITPPTTPTTARSSLPRTRSSQYPFPLRTAPNLPTLYEVSIASTDDVTVMGSPGLNRINSYDSTDSNATSIAPSIAPSVAPSFTPSVMSESWYQSPQERLGLGGRIRKSSVLPWEPREDRSKPASAPVPAPASAPQGKPKKSRLSIFSRN